LQCDETAFAIQDALTRIASLQRSSDLVFNGSHFLQMSISVVVAAMLDFVLPWQYCPFDARPFSSDKFNPSISIEDLSHRDAARQFEDRIRNLQEVKVHCDHLKHIKVRKINRSASEISAQRACYFGIVDLALHICWYSMCQRGEERCKYNIPQCRRPPSYLPFETYRPAQLTDPNHELVFEYEETPKIVERWSSGLLFLNKVMLPSLAMCTDPSSKAFRVCSVSSICNFLRTSAALDEALFKFLFIRDVVADHVVQGSVSFSHLLLETAAVCIDLEPEVALCVHNQSLYIRDEEELDEQENLWFPFKLLYRIFNAHVESGPDIFLMARLAYTFRLMKSLCSLPLHSASISMQHPNNPESVQPPTVYEFDHLEAWLSRLNNMTSEHVFVRQYLEGVDSDDNQFFTSPYFLICYMMICKGSTDLKSIPGLQNDNAAVKDYFCNHFLKVGPRSHKLHLKPNEKLMSYVKENLEAGEFSAQFYKETFFDPESEEFKYEFANRIFVHECMIANWVDFLSAYVELQSKCLSCPDVSEADELDKFEGIATLLKDALWVEETDAENHCYKRVREHVSDKTSISDVELWFKMFKEDSRTRHPADASDLSKQHPLDLNSADDPRFGGVSCLCICLSFWMCPYTSIHTKTSLVRYLKCHLEGLHNFQLHLARQRSPLENAVKTVKELAFAKCRWLFCVAEGPEDQEDYPVTAAINRDFAEQEWGHTIEILKLLRVMLIFETQYFKYIHAIVECLWSNLRQVVAPDDEDYHAKHQWFEVLSCFAHILSDMCESFDPADFYLSNQNQNQQRPVGISKYCSFRYAILRRVCAFQSNREPLCCLFLRVLSLVSRRSHYSQLMPAALAATRLLLTAHERQKELGMLRARDSLIFHPFEEVSLDSFEAIMISHLAVPYLFCAAGHMEIRCYPALSLFMSCLDLCDYSNIDPSNACSHRILLEFPKQLCSWASSSTLRSLSDSVLLLSSTMLLLSRILEDATRTIPNSSHGILSQILPSSEVPPSYRCGPAVHSVDRTLAFVINTLLEHEGFGFFQFHSNLKVRRNSSDKDNFCHPSHDATEVHSTIHEWIFSPSGTGLSSSSRRLSKFLSCQSMVHRNILVGDFFCQVSFGPANLFGTFHPFQLKVFERQECHDAVLQKLMDVGSDRSHENVKSNFSYGANTLVNFIANLQALVCVSVNSICDILRTCPPKTDSSHHAPSLAHILLNQHAMYSQSIVDDSFFLASTDDYHVSELMLALLSQVKGFFTVPSQTEKVENLNSRLVWLMPVLARSWEIIAFLLDDPFSRLLCTHIISKLCVAGDSWLWGSCGDPGEHLSRSTSLSGLIDCASFLNYFLKMNSNLNPSHNWECVVDFNGDDFNCQYLHQLHDLLSHNLHAISWSVKALKSVIWIVTTLCPERFSYDFSGLVRVWRWSESWQFWNRDFVCNYASHEPDERGDPVDAQPEVHHLEVTIFHAIQSRHNFSSVQQLFELLFRCRNNEFDDVASEAGGRAPPWFVLRLNEWYFFEDRALLGEVLSSGLSNMIDLPREWETVQNKAKALNIVLLTAQGPNFRWINSSHDPFSIIDRSKLDLLYRLPDPLLGSLPVNDGQAFKSISLHALHFNHALSLKSAKCHLAQSLGSLFSVIFRAHHSPLKLDLRSIYHREFRDDVETCVIFVDFALRMCLFLRDWLVSHVQADFTLRFLKAARNAIFRLKSFPDDAKETFLHQADHHRLFLKISDNMCQIIISKSSNINQAALGERHELYMLLLEYLSAFCGNDSASQGSDFVLQHVLCCEEQRYLPLAFYTILRDVADTSSFHSIEAIMLLTHLLRLVPATIAIVNALASRFGNPLIQYVEGPLSQSPLFSSVFHTTCLLLSRVVQRNPSLIAPVIVSIRKSPFFVGKGSFFSVIPSQQSVQENVAKFADQVIAFHLIADSFMCIIFRCAHVLDALQSFSACEGLLELLHFLHFSLFKLREGNPSQTENGWLLRLLRHFAGSRDPYIEYLVRRRACLPAPYMRPYTSFASALYGQVNAALLSLAVLQRHRVRNWSGAVPSLAVFNSADREVPQILVHTALFDGPVCGVDILELPRERFSDEDLEYDSIMAIYQ
jgi:hypothetical protein